MSSGHVSCWAEWELPTSYMVLKQFCSHCFLRSHSSDSNNIYSLSSPLCLSVVSIIAHRMKAGNTSWTGCQSIAGYAHHSHLFSPISLNRYVLSCVRKPERTCTQTGLRSDLRLKPTFSSWFCYPPTQCHLGQMHTVEVKCLGILVATSLKFYLILH